MCLKQGPVRSVDSTLWYKSSRPRARAPLNVAWAPDGELEADGIAGARLGLLGNPDASFSLENAWDSPIGQGGKPRDDERFPSEINFQSGDRAFAATSGQNLGGRLPRRAGRLQPQPTSLELELVRVRMTSWRIQIAHRAER